MSIHGIHNLPGTKRNIFIDLQTRKQSRNYHQPNFNLLYLRKLQWAHSIFLHITSGHNDLATEKIIEIWNYTVLFSGI